MADGIQQLTAAMAAGDSDAVAAFYTEYFDWMFIQARLATRRDEAFCLDVVQDAVLRVIRSVKSVDSEAGFRAWLRLVVQTTALDLLRGESRRKTREIASAVSEAVCEKDDGSEQMQWLASELKRLDPQLLRLIELRFEQRWTLRRIGALLGITTGAVDGRLRRAIHNLRAAHDDFSPDETAAHDDGM